MLISFNVLTLRAAIDLHISLNNSSGHTENEPLCYVFEYEIIIFFCQCVINKFCGIDNWVYNEANVYAEPFFLNKIIMNRKHQKTKNRNNNKIKIMKIITCSSYGINEILISLQAFKYLTSVVPFISSNKVSGMAIKIIN